MTETIIICRCGGMADEFDSKSNGETRGGSSPLAGTILSDNSSLEKSLMDFFVLRASFILLAENTSELLDLV